MRGLCRAFSLQAAWHRPRKQERGDAKIALSQAGAVANLFNVETIPFSNPASLARFVAIADKIERDPTLLAIPLQNMARWIAQGIDAPHRLEQWRTLILAAQTSPDALARLLEILRDDSEEIRQLKSYSPFAGVLTSRERQKLILESCGFRH